MSSRGGGYRGRGGGDFRGRGRGGPSRGGGGSPSRGGGPPRAPQQDLRKYDSVIPDEHLSPNDGMFERQADSKYVNRPGFSTQHSNTLTLVTNHFRVNLSRDLSKQKVYHYDVEIEKVNRRAPGRNTTDSDTGAAGGKKEERRPRKLGYKLNQKVLEQFRNLNSRPAGIFYNDDDNVKIVPVFDGRKNLYTVHPLGKIGTDPGGNVKQKVRIPMEDEEGGEAEFSIQIKVPGQEDGEEEKRCELDLSEVANFYNGSGPDITQEVIQAVNIIIRHGPAQNRIPVGVNSLYPTNTQRILLGSGKEMMIGHYQSVRATAGGLSLVVDRTATAFLPNLGRGINITAYISKLLNQQQFNPNFRQERRAVHFVETEFRKATFYVTHNGYKKTFKKLHSLDDRPPRMITFPLENGTETNVADYFRERFPKLPQLKYPDLPCMNFGNERRGNYIPMEYCFLMEDQHAPGRLDGDQTAEMIRATAIEPVERFRQIFRSNEEIIAEGRPYLKEFDIDLTLSPLMAVGKLLKPPSLKYNGRQIQPNSGKWDMRGIKLVRPTVLKNWVVYNFTQNDIEPSVHGLVSMGKNMGMSIGRPSIVNFGKMDSKGFLESFNSLPAKPDMIFWMQQKNDFFYQKMKQFCEVDLGTQNTKGYVVSQCCLEPTFMKNSPQTMANLILKINTKLGGINQCLNEKPAILQQPGGILIVGADVTHSAPADITDPKLKKLAGTRFEASIAAVVGTLDNEFFNYYSSVKVQKRERQEMIKELDAMFMECVKKWYQNPVNKKTLPQRVVFYRDGVSDGQFDTVLEDEFDKLIEACKTIGGIVKKEYRPKITFIIVQKRHHTRLRPRNPDEGTGRHKNVPPGTLVDTAIVHPRDNDWYLASHEGIQGTSRPTHYYVLKDENDMSADALYQLTYYLCHTYAKATRSISIPSPVMYAHLAAFRSRAYLVAAQQPGARVVNQLDRDLTESECGQVCAHLNSKIKVSSNVQNQMYYC